VARLRRAQVASAMEKTGASAIAVTKAPINLRRVAQEELQRWSALEPARMSEM
jgi:hypothetical protein